MQIFDYANMWLCKYVIMQACNHASMWLYKFLRIQIAFYEYQIAFYGYPSWIGFKFVTVNKIRVFQVDVIDLLTKFSGTPS